MDIRGRERIGISSVSLCSIFPCAGIRNLLPIRIKISRFMQQSSTLTAGYYFRVISHEVCSNPYNNAI